MRISEWSSDVCSSDLGAGAAGRRVRQAACDVPGAVRQCRQFSRRGAASGQRPADALSRWMSRACGPLRRRGRWSGCAFGGRDRSEEHTSELQSLMRISYAVFCLKKKKPDTHAPRACCNMIEAHYHIADTHI